MPALMYYVSVPVLARRMLGRCAPALSCLWRMVSRCSKFYLGGLGEERSAFGYVPTIREARGTLWSCHQHYPEPLGRLITASPQPSVKNLLFWCPFWRLHFQSHINSVRSMKMFLTVCIFWTLSLLLTLKMVRTAWNDLYHTRWLSSLTDPL